MNQLVSERFPSALPQGCDIFAAFSVFFFDFFCFVRESNAAIYHTK